MKYLYSLVSLLLTVFLSAQTVSSDQFSSGFVILVDMDFDQSGNMYAVEKQGRIQFVDTEGTKANQPLLDISGIVNSAANERGLLGMALHPDYENNGLLYVHYTRSGGTSVISRFSKDISATIDPSTEDIILEVLQPFSNHNAGALNFGPDGYLYIGMGDGGSGGDPGNRSQNPQLHLGKMLRIDVSGASGYTVPTDNPFVSAQDTLPEIWSMGLRNPWKFSFDILTGDMYIADVGQNKWEEVDFQSASSSGGENFGWRCYEGFDIFNSNGCGDASLYTPPIHVYENDDVNVGCSITGGYVYRSQEIPYLSGKYIYGDYCTGKIWALHRDECGVWQNEEVLQVLPNELSTFGQDREGNIYYGLIGEGTVHRLGELCTLTASAAVIDPSCSGQANGSIDVQVAGAIGQIAFEIESGEFTGLTAGEYSITITDDQLCRTTLCATLTDPSDIEYPDLESQLITICEGEASIIDFNIFFEGFSDLGKILYLNDEVIDADWDGILLADSSGSYSVQFEMGGCLSPVQQLTDIFTVQAGTIEIELSDDMLFATDGFTEYQWYANGVLQEGETESTLSNFEVGVDYRVEGFTIFGCIAVSEIFSIVNTVNPSLANLIVSPNPTSDFITISGTLDGVTEARLTIFALDGSTILYSTKVASSEMNVKVDISTYATGTYILTISNEDQSISKRILKH